MADIIWAFGLLLMSFGIIGSIIVGVIALAIYMQGRNKRIEINWDPGE